MQEQEVTQEGKDKENKKRDKAQCKHERTKKEYDRGIDTGDKICLDCGKLV